MSNTKPPDSPSQNDRSFQQRRRRQLTAACGLLGVLALGPAASAGDPPVQTGIDPAVFDRQVKPCDDFYRFACGTWLKKTEIPADRPSWSRGFSEINERNQLALRQILDETAAGKPPAGLSPVLA